MRRREWSGYDTWRIHGNRNRCLKCGSIWYDSDGGCGRCAEEEEEREDDDTPRES